MTKCKCVTASKKRKLRYKTSPRHFQSRSTVGDYQLSCPYGSRVINIGWKYPNTSDLCMPLLHNLSRLPTPSVCLFFSRFKSFLITRFSTIISLTYALYCQDSRLLSSTNHVTHTYKTVPRRNWCGFSVGLSLNLHLSPSSNYVLVLKPIKWAKG